MTVGPDAIPSFDALSTGYPGFTGFGVAPENEAERISPIFIVPLTAILRSHGFWCAT